MDPEAADRAVQDTNDDAQTSKLSCVRLGYFPDPFVELFVRRAEKRPPLINRGYFARHTAIEALLRKFLAAAGPRAQVLSLGAGYDTAWFQLKSTDGEAAARVRWVEVDFPEVTSKKVAAIKKHERLNGMLPPNADVDVRAGRLTSDEYCVVPADLRVLPAVEAALDAARLDASTPTFVLAECVLVYMDPACSSSLVGWLAGRLEDAVAVVYEMVRPSDAFGKMMVKNLAQRGAPLLGVAATPTLRSHEERFLQNGWGAAEALDLDTVYETRLDPEQVSRVEGIELMDEYEEWHLILQHYALTVAWRQADSALRAVRLDKLREARGQPRGEALGKKRTGRSTAPGTPREVASSRVCFASSQGGRCRAVRVPRLHRGCEAGAALHSAAERPATLRNSVH